jgi:hypothetical protein
MGREGRKVVMIHEPGNLPEYYFQHDLRWKDQEVGNIERLKGLMVFHRAFFNPYFQ